MMPEPLFELEGAAVPKSLSDLKNLSLDTVVLEGVMKENNGGVELRDLPSNHSAGDEQLARQHVPHFYRGYPNEEEVERIKETVNKFSEITGPCSMLVGSPQELVAHMLAGYQVSHFHYILGKKANIKGSFPKYCCGTSSLNVMLSLIELGYPNAALAENREFGHCYVILPFVTKLGGAKGLYCDRPDL